MEKQRTGIKTARLAKDRKGPHCTQGWGKEWGRRKEQEMEAVGAVVGVSVKMGVGDEKEPGEDEPCSGKGVWILPESLHPRS